MNMMKWVDWVCFYFVSIIFTSIVGIALDVNINTVPISSLNTIIFHQWNIVMYQCIKLTFDGISLVLFLRAFGFIDIVKYD